MFNLTAVLNQLRQQREQTASELRRLDEAISAISRMDGIRRGSGARRLSAAGRARIASAQRARWAKWKRQHKAA